MRYQDSLWWKRNFPRFVEHLMTESKKRKPTFWQYHPKEFGRVKGFNFDKKQSRFITVAVETHPDGETKYLVSIIHGSSTPFINFTSKESLKELAELLLQAYNEIPDYLNGLEYQRAVNSEIQV